MTFLFISLSGKLASQSQDRGISPPQPDKNKAKKPAATPNPGFRIKKPTF
jgi:hypothetical protein